MPRTENPFPGMNPYLEGHWSGVHARLITYIGDSLDGELPPDLSARIEEHVAMEEYDEGAARTYRPDIAIVESWEAGFPPLSQPQSDSGGIAVSDPEVVVVEPETDRWIEIRDLDGTLVTVIELISPANTREPGRTHYWHKQHDFLSAGANLVEIDLLRRGMSVAAIDEKSLAPKPKACLMICVSRAIIPGRREVYRWNLRDAIPSIRVPLRPADPDIPLPLQPLIDRCHKTGRYWQLDYSSDPVPPVDGEDTGWLDERLREAGLRGDKDSDA